MTRYNKKRYQSEEKPRIAIVLTGNIYLLYVDDEKISAAGKGDLMVYPQNISLQTTHQGEYGMTGFSGYFKVDVHDGKVWQPVIITDMFPHREHHFSKSECPIDTYELCVEILSQWKGKALVRTYREHYEPEEV